MLARDTRRGITAGDSRKRRHGTVLEDSEEEEEEAAGAEEAPPPKRTRGAAAPAPTAEAEQDEVRAAAPRHCMHTSCDRSG